MKPEYKYHIGTLCIYIGAFGAFISIMYLMLLCNYLPGYEIFAEIMVVPFLILLFLGKQIENEGIEKGFLDENGMSIKYNKRSKLSRREREALDKQRFMDMERILSSSQLQKMTKRGPKEPNKELNNLIGLSEVKQAVKEMAARLEFDKDNNTTDISAKHMSNKKSKIFDSRYLHTEHRGCSGGHMVFFGNPGTGKTTVARIITGILYQNKVIRKNQCIEVDGNFLTSDRESAKKITYLVNKALGGVLFIDEAYTLNDGYGEAISAIVKEMEDKRDDIVIIFAGYTKEMKKMIEVNPGFSSRIKTYLNFKDYTIEELKEIFILMARERSLIVDENALYRFEDRIIKEKNEKFFGNARTVRNILDESINHHSLNLKEGIIPIDKKFILTGEDISKEVKKIF